MKAPTSCMKCFEPFTKRIFSMINLKNRKNIVFEQKCGNKDCPYYTRFFGKIKVSRFSKESVQELKFKGELVKFWKPELGEDIHVSKCRCGNKIAMITGFYKDLDGEYIATQSQCENCMLYQITLVHDLYVRVSNESFREQDNARKEFMNDA